MRRRILIGLLGLVVLAAAAASYVIGPRNVVGMLLYDRRSEGTLAVGDAAPDVVLATLDGASEVRLLDALQAKETVLVFGSYT